MINFYRDMWIRRSAILTPLTELPSKDTKWKWTKQQEKAFPMIKEVMNKEVLLAYPTLLRNSISILMPARLSWEQ